jgi:hypothetical protein
VANPARSKFHAAVLRRAVRVEDRREQPCELVRDRRRRRRPHRYGRDGPAIVGDRAGMAEQAEAAVSKPFPFGGWGSTPSRHQDAFQRPWGAFTRLLEISLPGSSGGLPRPDFHRLVIQPLLGGTGVHLFVRFEE